jgi:diguanylate cyclase (GGDEF)-like protein/PAS domain S-box-containing protein
LQVSPVFKSLPSSLSHALDGARRGSVKGILVVLVLVVLSLLLWELRQEFQQAQASERRRSLESGIQLADHLAASMRLKAQAALVLLHRLALEPVAEPGRSSLLGELQRLYPSLRSIAWLDARGRLLEGSGGGAALPALLRRAGGDPFHYLYAEEDGGSVYLLLRQGTEDRARGHWLLRLDGDSAHRWLLPQGGHDWLLEDSIEQRVIARGSQDADPDPRIAPLNAEERSLSIRVLPLPGSDWQLRALFDAAKARAAQWPALSGKLLLFLICGLLMLGALLGLLREQHALRELNAASRRSLRQADSALRAIEESVLLSHADGRVSYLNPQAEDLFGLSDEEARGLHLLDLLPGLDPLLLNVASIHRDLGTDLVELARHGETRLFAVTRSELSEGERQQGFVWVMRDVSDEQQSMGVLRETRRRYQDIFEGSGIALCVLDLAGLPPFLQREGVVDRGSLQAWLQAHPQRDGELRAQMRLTEANQVALQLIDAGSLEAAWQRLLGSAPSPADGLHVRLVAALLDGQRRFEMETRILTAEGDERHLWMVLRLPELASDWHAVTLSISDITSRKRTELSLTERERFWSEVVRAAPDMLYVHDMLSREVVYSNHSLGLKLGYSKPEIRALGKQFWEQILHPDDSDYYWRVRAMQQVIGHNQLLESQLRWRHRDGRWHWFSIREQALSRTPDGRVKLLIGVAKDITEQIEASESLRDSERRYRLLAESISDVIFTTADDLRLNYLSPSVMELLGYDSEWIMRNGMRSLIANPAQLGGFQSLVERIREAQRNPQQMLELRNSQKMQLFVLDCLRADDRKITIELRAMPLWDEHGRFEGMLGIVRDVSPQRRAEKELRMAATVFEHSTAAILVTDPAGYIVQVNEAFSRISGYASDQVLDQLPNLLTAESHQSSHMRYILAQLNQHGSWEGEVWLKRQSGENYPAWVGITAVHDDEDDLVSYVCFFSDMSERKASEQRIHRLAYYDPLTHLPNRTLFQDRLYTALQSAERREDWVVLMFLDLDRFKPINDSLGHAAGDRMLQEVALRLVACSDDADTVARMGGDEFTLLLRAQECRENALTRAIHVGEQILASLARPFILEGREFFVTASIGIALSPQDGDELSQLMKNADTAMYHAKERGKNNFQFYQAEMNASALERLELESDLRHALEQGQFVLHYQPQLSGDGKRLTGAEALLRWQHPSRGLVSPSDFIPVLEEIGLVVPVGDWVLSEACRQLKAWHQARVRLPKISVNLSARQFADGQLGERIASILAESGVPAACLELELTESILMRDVGEAMAILDNLKSLGLCIAVDDFGTGYSSLNYLKQFPIDVLKIDRSFVDGLPEGEQDAQIARAIIAMAHSLNLAVIAEGVETQAQLDFLRQHGCDEVQGYLFGRPMPAAQFQSMFSGAALFVLG